MRQSEPGPHKLRLDLPAAHGAGRMARKVVGRFARSEGIGENEARTLELVASELLSNAVDHGGGRSAMEEHELEDDVRMTLELEIGGASWELRVTDQGGGDPSEVEPYLRGEVPKDPEDERGRGFFLLAGMVDRIEVRRSPDGKGLEFLVRRKIGPGA